MDNTKFISTKKACSILSVCGNTLRTWEAKGLIRAYRITPRGQRKYDISDLIVIKAPKEIQEPERQNIIYCRVSSKSQKDDLQRQIEYLKEKYPNHHVITDIGSGLNYKRRGLLSILDRAIKGTIGEVVVSYRDRLCRFGFDLVEHIINTGGGKIVVLESTHDSLESEMVKDLTSIIHVFSCRLYGLRKYKKIIKKACTEKETPVM
jgi:predicted site-specific integrase-resolvase